MLNLTGLSIFSLSWITLHFRQGLSHCNPNLGDRRASQRRRMWLKFADCVLCAPKTNPLPVNCFLGQEHTKHKQRLSLLTIKFPQTKHNTISRLFQTVLCNRGNHSNRLEVKCPGLFRISGLVTQTHRGL